jgi:Uma2 family endonuclease
MATTTRRVATEEDLLAMDKVGEYLEAGVRLIWVIDPRHARAVVHRSLSDVRELGPDGVFDGEDVVPGFRCALGDIL